MEGRKHRVKEGGAAGAGGGAFFDSHELGSEAASEIKDHHVSIYLGRNRI